MTTKKKRINIPCMRGVIGSWDTFNCLMRLEDIANNIHFAKELHTNKKLSQMIQRKLEGDRAGEISEYLITEKDRFFNSLVVAIYNGDPTWYDIGGLTANNSESESLELPTYAQECMGILSVPEDQHMFALDGQHRLAGIKKAVEDKPELKDEQLSVVIVVHKETDAGVKRSRRLFTTLNKKAKLVKKDAIIALDEDDISACITRHLVENTKYFNEHNVRFSIGSLSDKTNITTLGNIYDCTQKLVAYKLKCSTNKIHEHKIPIRSELEQTLFKFADDFYRFTFMYIKELKQTIGLTNLEGIIEETRNSTDGGHMLFRPIGWDLYTDLILSQLKANNDLEETIKLMGSLDLNLSGELLANTIWSIEDNKIDKMNSATTKKLHASFQQKLHNK